MSRERLIGLLIVVGGLIAIGSGMLARSWFTVIPGKPVAAEATAPTHQISVTGEGTVSVTPDVAHLVLGVDLRGPTLGPIQQEAAQRMQAILQALQQHGAQADRIRTVTYTVAIQTDQSGHPIGYQVRDVIDVPIQPIDQAGPALDAAITAGATVVEGVRFTHDDLTDAMRQARERAVQDAQTKARQLATAAGISLGPVISLTENTVTPLPAETRVAAGATPSTPLPPGELTVRVTVNVVYSIP